MLLCQQHGDQCALYVQVSTSWVSLPLPLGTTGHWHQDSLKKIVLKIKTTLAALLSVFVLSDIQFSSFHTTHNNAVWLGDNCNDKLLLSCHFNRFWFLHTFNTFNKKKNLSKKIQSQARWQIAFLRNSCINSKEKTEYGRCDKNTAFSFTSKFHSKILSYFLSGNQGVLQMRNGYL